jgi:hypothetical protein
MNEINNTVLQTYTARFDELSKRGQFHFASRLYLWHRLPEAAAWLDLLRPGFTAHDQPLQSLAQLMAEPLPILKQTAELRNPYFTRYPQLRSYERIMFRLLFLQTIYGFDSRQYLYRVLPREAVLELYQALLADREALCQLSSYAINFLYIVDRFGHQDDASAIQPKQLLGLAQTQFTGDSPLDRQLECYFYTHCILAETLFYSRALPSHNRHYYLAMLEILELTIESYFETTKLDICYEFLVCCRILNYKTHLEALINTRTTQSMHAEGFIAEPLNAASNPSTLQNSEHRNVLFILSQLPYQPLY